MPGRGSGTARAVPDPLYVRVLAGGTRAGLDAPGEGHSPSPPSSSPTRAKVLVPPCAAYAAHVVSLRASISRFSVAPRRHEPALRARSSSSPRFPGSTSPVDYGGDAHGIPCPGSHGPYHLHHGVQGGRRLPVPPEGGTGSSLQSAKRYGILRNLGIPRGIPRFLRMPEQVILVMFIHCPSLTRRVPSLTRLGTLLPRRRTASKVDVVRRASWPQACGHDAHRPPCRTRSHGLKPVSAVNALVDNVRHHAHARVVPLVSPPHVMLAHHVTRGQWNGTCNATGRRLGRVSSGRPRDGRVAG